jgi:hypothetical protein
MFAVNNLLNCLVFGEQLTHSGHNYRGNNVWWIGFMSFVLNCLAIGFNILLVTNMQGEGRPMGEIVQSQHFFLVCTASGTSLIVSIFFYFSYRLN